MPHHHPLGPFIVLKRTLISASAAALPVLMLASPAAAETTCDSARGITTCTTTTSTPLTTHLVTAEAASDDSSVAWRFCVNEVPSGSTVTGYVSTNSRFDVSTETTTTTTRRGASARGPVLTESTVTREVITFVDTPEGSGGCFFSLPSGQEERWSFQIVASSFGDDE